MPLRFYFTRQCLERCGELAGGALTRDAAAPDLGDFLDVELDPGRAALITILMPRMPRWASSQVHICAPQFSTPASHREVFMTANASGAHEWTHPLNT